MPYFQDIWGRIRDRAVVGEDRCLNLHRLAQIVARPIGAPNSQSNDDGGAVAGEIWECGVYRGGTARLLAESAPGLTIRLFDTFSGMPECDPAKDLHRAGDFADTSLDEVAAFLSDCPNVRIHAGLIPETFAGLEGHTIAMLHLDVDIYASVHAGLHWCYPRMSPDGLILIDDYGFPSCPGAREATDEFFGEKPEGPIRLATGPAIVMMAPMRDGLRQSIASALHLAL